MTSPYIFTCLNTDVTLRPHQMNNNLYINLKDNLVSKLQNKCFESYGYIMEIIKITLIKNNIIASENRDASALYEVTFLCKLCIPIKNKEIICMIEDINKTLIKAVNGPISVIITNDRINVNNFFIDNNNNFKYKNKNKNTDPLFVTSKQYVKVKLETVNMNHKDSTIKVIGYLIDMATEDEIKLFNSDLNYQDPQTNIVNYDEYIAKSK